MSFRIGTEDEPYTFEYYPNPTFIDVMSMGHIPSLQYRYNGQLSATFTRASVASYCVYIAPFQ